MKALSLMEPWASLVALGAKSIETRSWRTHYRGAIAIAASRSVEAIEDGTAARLFGIAHRAIPFRWPQGEVVAIATLYDCVRTEELVKVVPPAELMFGDFSARRWGWLLKDVELLAHTIPVKGALGVFEIPHGEDFVRSMVGRLEGAGLESELDSALRRDMP